MADLFADHVALVTGASRGIGWATACALAQQGAHIIALARTIGGLEELDDEIKKLGGTTTLVPMDLHDFSALDQLGAEIFSRWRKLDILIGNAAILGKLTPLPHVAPKMWEELMAVNVTANYRLIRSLDPLLREAPAGRAVFLTSSAARKALPFWGPYAVSKAALETMVQVYAHEVATTRVRANCFNPGRTRTKMRAQAMPGEDPQNLPTPQTVAAQIIPMCCPDFISNGAIYHYAEGTTTPKHDQFR